MAGIDAPILCSVIGVGRGAPTGWRLWCRDLGKLDMKIISHAPSSIAPAVENQLAE